MNRPVADFADSRAASPPLGGSGSGFWAPVLNALIKPHPSLRAECGARANFPTCHLVRRDRLTRRHELCHREEGGRDVLNLQQLGWDGWGSVVASRELGSFVPLRRRGEPNVRTDAFVHHALGSHRRDGDGRKRERCEMAEEGKGNGNGKGLDTASWPDGDQTIPLFPRYRRQPRLVAAGRKSHPAGTDTAERIPSLIYMRRDRGGRSSTTATLGRSWSGTDGFSEACLRGEQSPNRIERVDVCALTDKTREGRKKVWSPEPRPSLGRGVAARFGRPDPA